MKASGTLGSWLYRLRSTGASVNAAFPPRYLIPNLVVLTVVSPA